MTEAEIAAVSGPNPDPMPTAPLLEGSANPNGPAILIGSPTPLSPPVIVVPAPTDTMAFRTVFSILVSEYNQWNPGRRPQAREDRFDLSGGEWYIANASAQTALGKLAYRLFALANGYADTPDTQRAFQLYWREVEHELAVERMANSAPR